MQFENTIFLLKSRIATFEQRRRYCYKELKKEMPYKCRTKKEAAKSHAEYRRSIAEINVELKEFRRAIKILQK